MVNRANLAGRIRTKRWFGFSPSLRGSIVDTLSKRGLVSQLAGENLDDTKGPLSIYLGADPSAPSLHLGNLLPIMVLSHLYIRGNHAVPLVGGATGVVGDPSGRKTERSQQQQETRNRNVELLGVQFRKILENSAKVAAKYMEVKSGTITSVNNADWWSGMGILEFLGTYGKHIRLSAMLGRESVKQRLNSEQGIGFAEFSYQVLQAYDFWHLYNTKNVTVQIGGHDQWGNITAGIDLIGRLRKDNRKEAYGITVPLLTTPSGEKFGKSAGNAVFLSAEETKPYHLYQHLLKSPDSVVQKYLEIFTFIPLDDINALMEEHKQSPEQRAAQHRLAQEVTELVHGPESAQNCRTVSAVLFDSTQNNTAKEIIDAFDSQGLVKTWPRDQILGSTWKNFLAEITGRSKSECQRLLSQKAVYAGLNRIIVDQPKVAEEHIDESLLLVRIGKTEYHMIRLL